MLVIVAIIIIVICVVIKAKRKNSATNRQLQQVTPPQPSVVRYSVYPSVSQHAPQLSTSEETKITSSVPQHAPYGPFYYDTEHAAVGSTANPSVLRSPIKANTSPSDYPDPPPYDECTPGISTNNQSALHGGISSVSSLSYSSVVSTSEVVPVPPATNI